MVVYTHTLLIGVADREEKERAVIVKVGEAEEYDKKEEWEFKIRITIICFKRILTQCTM